MSATIVGNFKNIERLTPLDYVFELILVMVAREPIPNVQQFFQHLHPPFKIDKSLQVKKHILHLSKVTNKSKKKHILSNKNSFIRINKNFIFLYTYWKSNTLTGKATCRSVKSLMHSTLFNPKPCMLKRYSL